MRYNAFQECTKVTGIDIDIVIKAVTGEIPASESIKKYLVCVNQKLGFMDKDGQLHTEVFKEKTGRYYDKIDELIKNCFEDKGNAEDSAFNSAKCALKWPKLRK